MYSLPLKGFGGGIMSNTDGDIDALTRSILIEARAETDDLRAEAQARADAINQKARAEAESERARILGEARQQADGLRRQATAAAQLKARARELDEREQLLDKVFDAVEAELPNVIRRDDLERIATMLVRQALDQLRADSADVLADPLTQKSLTPDLLARISAESGVRLSLGKTLDHGTGVVVQAEGGRLSFDNTLETRLARLRSALRAEVYHVLMGEKA